MKTPPDARNRNTCVPMVEDHRRPGFISRFESRFPLRSAHGELRGLRGKGASTTAEEGIRYTGRPGQQESAECVCDEQIPIVAVFSLMSAITNKHPLTRSLRLSEGVFLERRIIEVNATTDGIPLTSLPPSLARSLVSP